MKKSTHTLNNMIWKFVTLVVSIILARILDPSSYGAIAIVNIFISLANVFVSDGLGSALIQRKKVDTLDYSSVLYFNIMVSAGLYLVLYFIAPFISSFYGSGYEILTPVLRVMGIKLILAAINSVQQAYVSRNMIFKKFFWATLIGTVVSGIVGVWMAYAGYGIWALVGQYLTNSTVDTIVLGISLRKRPAFVFSFARVKSFIKFGSGILATGLLTTLYTKIRALLIGKIYSSADLAYYERASKFPDIFVTNINSSISAVIFPRLSQEQDNKQRIKELMRQFVRLSSYLLIPLLIGLAAVSNSLVKILLTDKWLPCVFLLQMLCLNHIFRPLHTANIQALKAIGRSDITFRLEVIKKTIEIVTLIAVMRISVEAIVINMVIMSAIFTAVNAYPVNKYIGYSYKEQITDILPTIVLSGLMFLSVILFGMLEINIYLKLVCQILIGISTFIGLSIATKNKELKVVIDMIGHKRKGKVN